MPRARRILVSLDGTPYYHCTSRCVGRAVLIVTQDASAPSDQVEVIIEAKGQAGWPIKLKVSPQIASHKLSSGAMTAFSICKPCS